MYQNELKFIYIIFSNYTSILPENLEDPQIVYIVNEASRLRDLKIYYTTETDWITVGKRNAHRRQLEQNILQTSNIIHASGSQMQQP